MGKFTKHITIICLLLVALFALSGCKEALEKPTGLEESSTQETSAVGAEEKDQSVLEDKETNKEEEKQTEILEEQEGSVSTDTSENQKVQDTKHADSVKSKTNDDSSGSHQNNTNEKSNQTSTKDSYVKEKTSENKAKSTDTSKGLNNKEETVPSEESSAENSEETVEDKVPEKKADTIVYSIVISGSEVPLSPTEIEISNGDTVLDALIQITKQKKIQMDYRGGQGATAYVEGIANVYEFDRGQGSGWMYRINGVFPDRGAGVVPVCDGDRVEWLYTTNLGKDLGADLAPVRRDGKCPK